MSLDLTSIQHTIHEIPIWAQYAAQGIADASTTVPVPTTVTSDEACVGFDALCYANKANPFKLFDSFQGSIQASVVGLHGFLEVNFYHGTIFSIFHNIGRLC